MPLKREEYNGSKWLKDAAVQSKICYECGRWEVSLLFFDTRDPKHLLVQKIGDYHSKTLAEIYAQNMEHTAAKDARGTQKVNRDAYDINDN